MGRLRAIFQRKDMEQPPVIHKNAADFRLPPNWVDYEAERAAFN